MYSGKIPFVDLRNDIEITKRILSGAKPTRTAQMTSMGLGDALWAHVTKW